MLRGSSRRLNVGAAVSAEIFNKEWPDHLGSPRERLINIASREFGMANVTKVAAGGAATWPGANDVIALPFSVFREMTVYQLGWINGSGTMTDSVDIGIYDAAWNRKVSSGGTARSGVGLLQWVDVTDTPLPVGRYFLAASANGTTANQYRNTAFNSATGFVSALGVQDSATASYPLPDPLAGMAAASIFATVPLLLIAARVPF